MGTICYAFVKKDANNIQLNVKYSQTKFLLSRLDLGTTKKYMYT